MRFDLPQNMHDFVATTLKSFYYCKSFNTNQLWSQEFVPLFHHLFSSINIRLLITQMYSLIYSFNEFVLLEKKKQFSAFLCV